jgi:hypothetical protein
MSLYGPITDYLANKWVKSFKKAPTPTGIITAVIVASITTGIYFIDKNDKQQREAIRAKSMSYVQQIERLNETEKNVKQLLEFVELQKVTLRENQDVVTALKAEHEKLKPIVDADRNVVNAVLQAQEEKSRANIWTERWIGFGFGIVASILASVIVGIARKFTVKKTVAE